jgi:Flp pilus assembly protein TadD
MRIHRGHFLGAWTKGPFVVAAMAALFSPRLPAQNAGAAPPAPGNGSAAIAVTSLVTPPPSPGATLAQQGLAAQRVGRLQEAIDDFTKAIQLDPTNEQAYKWRGFAYRSMGQHEQAIADFNQAILLNPKDSRAYSQRAFTYRLEGKNDLAIADFTMAVQLDPTNAYAFNHRGNIYDREGQYEKALNDYIQAIQANPTYIGALNNLAWLLSTCPSADFRNGKKAVEFATKACDLSQWKNPQFVDTFAAACAEAGDFDNAVKWETQFLAMPIGATRSADGQGRLALYQARQPYHTTQAVDAASPESAGAAQ